MAGELLIQVFDIGRYRAIRPALDELEAARTLGPESQAVLREAAASPVARRDLGHFDGLLARILRHPELELRLFLAPGEVDVVIEGVVHVLCFENGAEFSLVTPVGPSWVVLDSGLAVFMDLDWFRATLFRPTFDPNAEANLLAYPRAGLEGRYYVSSREDVARVAAGIQPLLHDPIPTEIAGDEGRAAPRATGRRNQCRKGGDDCVAPTASRLVEAGYVQRSHRCLSQRLSGPHPGYWAGGPGAGE